jgi:hypothetical protein
MTAAENKPAVGFKAVDDLTIGAHISGLHAAQLVEKAGDRTDLNVSLEGSNG